MTVIKRNQVIFPTGEEDRAITAAALSDPDVPPLTDEQLSDMRRLGHHLAENENRVQVRMTPGPSCLARHLYKNTASITITPCLSTRPDYALPDTGKKNAPCFFCAYKKEGGRGFCKRSRCMDVVFDCTGDMANKNRHKIFLAEAANLDWNTMLALSCTEGKTRYGIGLIDQRVHVVAFTDTGKLRRVISLRRANLKEALHYAGQTAQGGMQGSRGHGA